MPLFTKKTKNCENEVTKQSDNNFNGNTTSTANLNNTTKEIPPVDNYKNQQKSNDHGSPSNNAQKPQLVFHTQLAHGSPTGLITGFTSVKELYQKIADCYDFPSDEILFCTLNSHKIDMAKLLGSQIGLDDFIFAHKKGRPKEIEIEKSEDSLGLTITDNGTGYAFIKRIKEGSIIANIPVIMVGDHIEKLNNESVVGKRHFEVARMLKEIPKGRAFTIRLVEPMKSGFQGIGPREPGRNGKKNNYGSGKETLRLKANGQTIIEADVDDTTQGALEAINILLDSFMGINDTELANQIWDLGKNRTNSMDFAEALDNSELEVFGFTDDFIIELWGAITDAKQGRIKNNKF